MPELVPLFAFSIWIAFTLMHIHALASALGNVLKIGVARGKVASLQHGTFTFSSAHRQLNGQPHLTRTRWMWHQLKALAAQVGLLKHPNSSALPASALPKQPLCINSFLSTLCCTHNPVQNTKTVIDSNPLLLDGRANIINHKQHPTALNRMTSMRVLEHPRRSTCANSPLPGSWLCSEVPLLCAS